MVSLAKWLSVRLRTKWLWVRISLLSLKKTLLWPLFKRISSAVIFQTLHDVKYIKILQDVIEN